MMSSDPYPLPPPLPTPATVGVWAGQVRAVLPLLGGLGAGGAWAAKLTDTQINGYVTAGLTLFALACWGGSAISSWFSKIQAQRDKRKAEVAAAIASANATHTTGVPTAVTVIPATAGSMAMTKPVPLAEAVAAQTSLNRHT
jgi:hypothetical protein